jgi:hypothetical protein
MKRTIQNIAIIATLLLPVAAFAFEPMAATIKISGAGIYDYILIGESPRATDGFDNAYDTMSPGDSLNTNYISSYISHPEWGAIKNNFRGDIRSIAETQEWTITIASSLPAGTPLNVELQTGLNILPQGLQLTIKDIGNTTSANLINGRLSISSPAPGATTQLIITAQQQATPPIDPPPPVVTKADGDLDGDGQATIADAIKVLRMALNLDLTTTAAKTHGDMDNDGSLTVRDALQIIRKSVGLI